MKYAVLILMMSGCVGSIVGGSNDSTGAGAGGSNGSNPSGAGPESPAFTARQFTCSATQTPAEAPLKRLSRTQYVNSVRDFVSSLGLATSDREAVLTALAVDLEGYPVDQLTGKPGDKHGGFTRLDQAVQQEHVDAEYRVATHLGALLMETSARRTAVVGSCATDASTSNDSTCLTGFVNKVGPLALRRPLTSAEVTFISEVAQPTPVDVAALADVVALLLSMPQFVYHVEEVAPTGAAEALDAWALANRLSYHFWQTAPDAALRQAASTGALLTPSEYASQVERLYKDARTDATVRTFFSEWLRLDELPPLDTRVGTPVFDAFAGSDKPAVDLHIGLKEEVADLALWLARSTEPVSALLTSRKHVSKRADVSKLYHATPWDGVSPPSDLPEQERSGLLTRAALLANPSGNTRPVMKGLRIRNGLMCQNIPPPPPSVNPVPPELSATVTTRESIEALTGVPGTVCAGCHATLLNPMGYLSEDFDALGRHRTVQRLFNADGSLSLERPVVTRAAPHIANLEGEVADMRELTTALAVSGEFETCFARQYFRYSFQRLEDDVVDGCTLGAVQAASLAGAPMQEILRSVALRDEFKRKAVR